MITLLNKSDYEELADFRYRLRKFLRVSEQALRKVGITPNQYQLLLAIQGFPERAYASPTELAERMQLRHNSCLGLIERCEQATLVQRSENPNDKRSVYICLTDKSRDVLRQLEDLHLWELAITRSTKVR